MPQLEDLTPEQIADMSPEAIVHYLQQMKMQIASKSKARIEWETYLLEPLVIGHATVFYKPERLAENKNPFCSLFLFEPTLKEKSYPLFHITIKDPEQSKVDRIKSDFIKRILDLSMTNFEALKPAKSSWEGLPDAIKQEGVFTHQLVTQLSYPLQLAARVRYKPNEWTDKNTGETRQGYRKQFGFALQFDQKINDYAQEIRVLNWETFR